MIKKVPSFTKGKDRQTPQVEKINKTNLFDLKQEKLKLKKRKIQRMWKETNYSIKKKRSFRLFSKPVHYEKCNSLGLQFV